MDYKTKAEYRNKIKELSKKTKISELYITNKALELAKQVAETQEVENLEKKRKTHIGYYLIAEGIQELYKSLQTNKKINICTKQRVNQYIFAIVVFSFILASLVSYTNLAIGIGFFLLLYIPMTQITTQIVQWISGKWVKPKLLPKLDYSEGIPKESATMVIIPTIVNSGKKVKDLMSKLEVFSLANRSENLYFTLLGDATSESKQTVEKDKEIIQMGIQEAKRLNEKYPTGEGMGKFHFIYRNRIWQESEQCFLGWERKRGMIVQFNEYLLGKQKNPFRANTIEQDKEKNPIVPIQYIITLDADTNLVLNSGLELVGAAAHLLNRPILNAKQDLVINGHALIQPRVGIDLVSSRKSLFAQIFAGAGGIDSYTNAISDVYQDNFGEGIFTGKGIYDLATFSTILEKEIPENTVLSHDLLEGNYLRCGLATDILLLDGFPYKYNAFIGRLHRWIRGDWQITQWLKKEIQNKEGKKKKNPLTKLAKFKILDNLRRSLVEIMVVVSLVIAFLLKITLGISITPVVIGLVLSILMPMLLDLISYITSKESGAINHNYFLKTISGLKASLLRGVLAIAFLPHKAVTSLNAICKTIYRKNISKQHLLEWTTAEEAEKNAKTNLVSYYQLMISNSLFAILGIVFLVMETFHFDLLTILGYAICVLWILAPMIAWKISQEIVPKAKVKELTKDEIHYVLEVGKRTWKYFNTYMNQENHYLPPDNYQEDRIQKTVARTSSTNIGLGLLAIISAQDLGYITLPQAMEKLENTIHTIMELSKWHGHLYNWYDTKTLQPLLPRYISTVDSGNFVGYLYVVKEFLRNVANNPYQKDKQKQQTKAISLLQIVTDLIEKTNFKVLYDYEKRLFSIGFSVEENKLTNSYYDLLASEARQASFVAIAKQDVPSKHWQNLSRTLTTMKGYKGLVSWSGTAFEYLMPNINIPKYEGSLLDESCHFMIMSQQEYAKKLGIPWGISESAFNLKDLNSNYQYKAFGIPWLGLKRGLADERVVSPYGSILAIPDLPKEVIQNMKCLEDLGMYAEYGFYESMDYTPSRRIHQEDYAIVKTYMAHHQALILLSINNLINSQILQERFIGNPEIKATDILLQERMPEDVIITKERKEKLKNVDYETYTQRVFTKLNEHLNNYNCISNEDYTICVNERGEGFSKYKDILINRFKGTNDYPQGIFFYLKNIRNKRIWTTGVMGNMVKPDKYEVDFLPDTSKFLRTDENIVSTCEMIVAPNDPVEIRRVELKNIGNREETLEITSIFEPVLSTTSQDYSHMAFNNLFLKYEYLPETNALLVKRNKRGNVEPIYLGVTLCTQQETIGELEYEIDEAKLNGGVLGVPNMIQNSIPFSNHLGLTVDPIVALKRTVKIPAGETVTFNLILSVSGKREEVEENMRKYTNLETTKRAFELSKVRVEEEARYLGIKGTDIEVYQKLLSYLIVQNPMKKLWVKEPKQPFSIEELWKYGISGDNAILLVTIKDVNDVYSVKELLQAYEFFRAKNIVVDLVILNEEENVYERYVKEAVEAEILNRHLMHLVNTKGGIYLLNANEMESTEALRFRANFLIDAHNGNIRTILHDKEEEYLNKIQTIAKDPIQAPMLPIEERKSNLISMEQLKYYNEYGGFSEDGKEYIIKTNRHRKPPTVWSHILANPTFGTIVTNHNSGYTWYRNSRLNRLTEWTNHTVFDVPSEILYFKDKEKGFTWTLSPNLNLSEEDYYITYGFGYAKYASMKEGLLQELEIFVPRKDNVKVNLLRLKNTTPEKKELKLIYYVKPVLAEEISKSNSMLQVKQDQNANILFAKNLFPSDIPNSQCYISSSLPIKSFTGNRKGFIGKGTILTPEGLQQQKLDNETALGQSSCMAIELSIELKAYEEKQISILLGSEEDRKAMQQTAYQYTIVENCKKELEETKKYW